MRFTLLVVGIAFAVVAADASPLANSRQCLVVVTGSWTSTTGRLLMFERNDVKAPWQSAGGSFDVRLGRAGLAWGRGLVDAGASTGPIKKEGDDKAPAGIFRLTHVFGSAHNSRMPFIPLSPDLVAVDDPNSRCYNRVIDQTKVKRDWRHAEKMFGVPVYRCGIVVEHNVPAKAGAGSCIFLHIWKNPATSTSGCTAMSERDLVRIVRWLDPAKHPLLVQLPGNVYDEMRERWRLPAP